MQHATQDLEQLTREHCALMRDYGRVQSRCTDQMRAQARETERLQAQVVRLRADAIVCATELAWAREDSEPQALLAQGLRFEDPLSGEERYFESRLALDW